VKETFGDSGFAEQHVRSEFIISSKIDEPDILRVRFELNLPEAHLTDGTIVYQYIQLIGVDADLTTGDTYIGLGCVTEVGNVDAT